MSKIIVYKNLYIYQKITDNYVVNHTDKQKLFTV